MGAHVEKFFDKARSCRRHRYRRRSRCRQCGFGFRETARAVPRSRWPSKRTRNKFNRAIVKGERSNSPIDEGWWLRRLQHDAGQIDVTPAFDVEL